jgi:hypothetical protein
MQGLIATLVSGWSGRPPFLQARITGSLTNTGLSGPGGQLSDLSQMIRLRAVAHP